MGIEGEAYQGPGDIAGTTDYIITDGKQKLQVRSDNYFTYYSDFDNFTLGKIPEEQAIIVIDNFLKKYGFDFEYHVASAAEMTGQQYYIAPLTSDNAEIRSDYLMPVRFEITIDGTGKSIIFSGFPLDYESMGVFNIITAEKAFQSVLDPQPQSGRMEMIRGNGGGGGGGPGFYKLNLSGTPVPFPSPTAQLQSNEETVEYTVQEGDTVFAIAEAYGITPKKIVQANSWLSDGHVLTPGKTLIIPIAELGSQSWDYIVQENDTLSSIALNFGITVDELMQANGITDTITFIGQTLIIPSPNGNPNQPPIGRRYEGERGIITVSIFNKPDGSQRSEYYLAINNHDGLYPYVILEGNGLEQLQAQHNHPIEIWGNVVRYNEQYNMPVVQVERFEIPFPDLQFQIIKGIAKPAELHGQTVILFTADNGITYVQMLNNGDIDTNIINDGSEYAMILGSIDNSR